MSASTHDKGYPSGPGVPDEIISREVLSSMGISQYEPQLQSAISQFMRSEELGL